VQFLVYLTLLTVSISTVLLEVHWLASPAPQPKQIVQASPPPAPKTEGPNAALTPVYPRKLDVPRPTERNAQAQNTSAGMPPATGQAAAALQDPVAPASRTAPAQEPAPAAPTTPTQKGSPATQSPPAQQPATAQPIGRPAAAAQSQAQADLAQAPTSQPSGTDERSRQKSSAEMTGIGTREDSTRQAAVGNPTGSMNRNDNPHQISQGSSSNRCDVQACANAYRSFRAADCTYQSFDGQRRFCGKPPGQQMVRDEREQRERRTWSRNTDARHLDRSTVGRRLDDDDDAELEDSDPGPPGFFFFGRRPRW
jgi:BA14K-like protein